MTTITSNYAKQFSVGQRVVFPNGCLDYPLTPMKGRLFGTVKEIDTYDPHADSFIWVHLDQYNEELDEWQNQVQVPVSDDLNGDTMPDAETLRPVYSHEFPDFDYPMPVIEGMSDESWHNDACPSLAGVTKDGTELRLWCDYADPTQRETESPTRFMLVLGDYGDTDAQTILCESDDIAEIEAAINAQRPLVSVQEHTLAKRAAKATSAQAGDLRSGKRAENTYKSNSADFLLDAFIQGWCKAVGVEPDGDAFSMLFQGQDEFTESEAHEILQKWHAGTTNETSERAEDQNGVMFDYGRLWGYRSDAPMSDGTQQCNTAKALQVAMDALEGNSQWSEHDKRLALSVLAGVRAQRGVMGPDADALGKGDEGLYATEQVDIWVFG